MLHLEGYQLLFAEIQTLVAMIEEQHTVVARDFHILFVDGSLFSLLMGNESRHWQDAIRGVRLPGLLPVACCLLWPVAC